MTLILSCLSKEYAVQVSDRRLTLPSGDIYDDNSNKAVLVNEHTIFGYTGLAYVDNGKTRADKWFLSMLQESYKVNPNASLTETAKYIAENAANMISILNISPELSRLAYIGIGWGKPPGKDDLCPIYTIISNAHDENGHWLNKAQPQFSVRHFSLPVNMPIMLVSDGQFLDNKIEQKTLRLLKRCVDREVGPNCIARILVSTARTVALTNPLVGRNLLVNSIPKSSVRIGEFKLIGSYPRRHKRTFMYIAGNTTKKEQYSPYIFAYGVSVQGIFVKQSS